MRVHVHVHGCTYIYLWAHVCGYRSQICPPVVKENERLLLPTTCWTFQLLFAFSANEPHGVRAELKGY